MEYQVKLGTYEEIKAKFLHWGPIEEEAARHHKEGCKFRLAVLCAIPIYCSCHNLDVCPEQDMCTCGRGDKVFTSYVQKLEEDRRYHEYRKFVDEAHARGIPNSAWVVIPGFSSPGEKGRAYIRAGAMYINGQLECVVTFANMSAKRTGRGEFKRLLRYTRATWPGIYMHVECVQTARFAEGLRRMGFEDRQGYASNFILRPEVPLNLTLPRAEKDKLLHANGAWMRAGKWLEQRMLGN